MTSSQNNLNFAAFSSFAMVNSLNINNAFSNVFGGSCINYHYVATPLWPSVGVKPNTPKVGDLESSGTPECLEFDSKDQNTSH
jgi:hypothetical protein